MRRLIGGLAVFATSVMAGAVTVASGCSAERGGSFGAGEVPPPGPACTQIGCQDGLVVQVRPAEAWPHGEYRYDIEHDGARVVCTGTLPLPPCARRAMRCDAAQPTIVESGCALEPTAHAFGDMMFSTTPAEVAAVVRHDGKTVGSARWRPVYHRSQPNGPGCEPVCTNATVEVTLAFE